MFHAVIGDHCKAELERPKRRTPCARIDVVDDLAARMIHQDLHLGCAQVLLQVERDYVFSVGMSLHDPFPAQTRATH